MLARIHRLTKKKDFEEVFLKGKGIKANFLTFKMLKNQGAESRFGFIVSKKVSLKANQRNTIKRRLRKAVASNLEKIKESVSVIIIALPQIKGKEFPEIQEAVIDSFKKFKIL